MGFFILLPGEHARSQRELVLVDQFDTGFSAAMLEAIQEYDLRHRFLSMRSREKSHIERAEFCLFMMMLFNHVDKDEVRDISELFEALDHNKNGLVDADDIVSHVAKTRVAKHHATSMHMLRKVHRKATRAFRRLSTYMVERRRARQGSSARIDANAAEPTEQASSGPPARQRKQSMREWLSTIRNLRTFSPAGHEGADPEAAMRAMGEEALSERRREREEPPPSETSSPAHSEYRAQVVVALGGLLGLLLVGGLLWVFIETGLHDRGLHKSRTSLRDVPRYGGAGKTRTA